MTLKILRLAASPGAWRMFMARKADQAFLPFSQKIFARDHYACQFCGFQAKQYQEIVNLDGNYSNNRSDNLATACCFCAQCFFLESVGVGAYGGGTLIFLPELAQAEVNAFCHVIFCAIANGTAYKETAQKIYRGLKFRSQPVETHYGEGTSKPAVLARLMLSHADQGEQQFASTLLNDLRLLPSQARFANQIEAWAAAALEEMPSDA